MNEEKNTGLWLYNLKQKKDKCVDVHVHTREKNSHLKIVQCFMEIKKTHNQNPPEMESSTHTHAAGQYAIFKYIHSF